jgi:hypothetical protein
MTLPESVIRELHSRLVTFDAPSFGKVKIDVELNYADGALRVYHLAAYPVETLKA